MKKSNTLLKIRPSGFPSTEEGQDNMIHVAKGHVLSNHPDLLAQVRSRATCKSADPHELPHSSQALGVMLDWTDRDRRHKIK